MFIFNPNALISGAQKGNLLCREKLIKKHYNFIARVCSKVCNRYLNWENDDELSIGLLAFNEAIDAFDSESNIKFTTFAGGVIKRRLIDYFRKQAKYDNEILPSEHEEKNELEAGINAKSVSIYQESITRENLANLIEYYKESLKEYGIDLDLLPEVSPKHRDTRQSLVKAAGILVDDQEMLTYLKRYGQLPVKLLCESTGLSRKVFERGRKYIIATALILSDPLLAPLRHFANISNDEGEELNEENQSHYNVV